MDKKEIYQLQNNGDMELKDLIKDTVTQIAEAATELNCGQTKYKLTVSFHL